MAKQFKFFPTACSFNVLFVFIAFGATLLTCWELLFQYFIWICSVEMWLQFFPLIQFCFLVSCNSQIISQIPINYLIHIQCAKFRRSRVIVSLVDLVPSTLCRFRTFSRVYFVDQKSFPGGTSWVSKFFSSVLRGSKNFFRGKFMGPKVYLVGTSWVRKFISWVLRESEIFFRCTSWVQ